MPIQKKFGAFAGVFTPSLLTILGVIMYMRLGWVVGNAGLIGTIVIIIIAHVISITTGLSISSIATDKKVGAGGIYYVLSRSLGLPIGGAIGVTLFTGTAMSIALYLIGFAESFNPYFGLDSGINGLRLGGSIALLTLTILALISTTLALKVQFFIMAAIGLSLLSIFYGISPKIPETLSYLPGPKSISMEAVFAIFFPAVTGFTAGIAMSGDLKDPKKSIPSGTLWAIGVGFIIYTGLAIFIFYSVDSELLKTDNNILLKLARFAPAVVAGIWGATLSSALGGILGGPRIMQAMSIDKIAPGLFARGFGKGNEPRNALFLTVLIAESGILIGELDTIARVCSMFYLAAYGFINLSFFLENWASSDFNPTFKVKKWVGLLGFVAIFVVMFRLDMIAMIAAFVVIGGIYFWLAKKQLALGSGDVWQSVWSSVVKTGLRRMDDKQDHKRNWKPNVLLFSGGTAHRPHLLEFSKELVGNRGIVTNFDLHENQEAKLLFPKHQQSVNDEILKKYGVFGRRLEVKNVFKGIESIASTFGFSGIEPNTILMGWAKNTKDPIWFAQMTQKLMDLDYNVLYLDYDNRFGFRDYSHIDLWWRGVGNNAELMLNITKFLVASELWRNAQIRILLVDDTNSNKKIIEKKIKYSLDEHRVLASVKVLGNAVEQRPLYELMKIYSSEADLVCVGIPGVKLEDAKSFVEKTNNLVSTIGTTLLVKASTQFDDIQFLPEDLDVGISDIDSLPKNYALPELRDVQNPVIGIEIDHLSTSLSESIKTFTENGIEPIQEKYLELYHKLLLELRGMTESIGSDKEVYPRFSLLMENIHRKIQYFRLNELPVLREIFSEETLLFNERNESIIKNIPEKLNISKNGHSFKISMGKTARFLQMNEFAPAIYRIFGTFGNNCFENLTKSINEIISKTYHFFELEGFTNDLTKLKPELDKLIFEIGEVVRIQSQYFKRLKELIEFELLSESRFYTNKISTICEDVQHADQLRELRKKVNKKKYKFHKGEILFFPQYWFNNQNVIHTSLETNLKLAQANIMINEGVTTILSTLKLEINNRIEHQFSQHKLVMQGLTKEGKNDLNIKSTEDFFIDESSFPGVDALMNQLTNQTTNIYTIINEDAYLMNKSLLEDYESMQFESVGPTMLDLPRIIDFILETKLFSPLQNYIERYLSEVSNIYYNQINRINLLKYSLKESKDKKEINELLHLVEERITTESDQFVTTKLRLEERMREFIYDLQMKLDTRYLVENADNWSRYINVSKRKKGLARVNENLRTKYHGVLHGLKQSLSAKKYESALSVFESKYNLKSNVELGLLFVRSIYPEQSVLTKLPFYYKQLFLGKHLPVQHAYIGREKEMIEIANSISKNRVGALLIIGKSGSGKSHFSEYLASPKIGKNIIRIDAVGKQGTVNELRRTISVATNCTEDIEKCFAKLPEQTTIIFSDVEVWWNRFLKVDALSVIIELVEKFGNSHRFILNGNLYAMEAMRTQRSINTAVATTIVLTPMSKNAMRDIIIERHTIGGLDLEMKNEQTSFDSKIFNKLISKIYDESQGNIGLGLQCWLRSIQVYADNLIQLGEPHSIEFLKITDSNWKWLLYQFIINNHLSNKKIAALFGDDTPEMKQILEEMIKSKIVDKVSATTYTLNSNIKPNIESWLTNQNILN